MAALFAEAVIANGGLPEIVAEDRPLCTANMWRGETWDLLAHGRSASFRLSSVWNQWRKTCTRTCAELPDEKNARLRKENQHSQDHPFSMRFLSFLNRVRCCTNVRAQVGLSILDYSDVCFREELRRSDPIRHRAADLVLWLHSGRSDLPRSVRMTERAPQAGLGAASKMDMLIKDIHNAHGPHEAISREHQRGPLAQLRRAHDFLCVGTVTLVSMHAARRGMWSRMEAGFWRESHYPTRCRGAAIQRVARRKRLTRAQVLKRPVGHSRLTRKMRILRETGRRACTQPLT